MLYIKIQEIFSYKFSEQDQRGEAVSFSPSLPPSGDPSARGGEAASKAAQKPPTSTREETAWPQVIKQTNKKKL